MSGHVRYTHHRVHWGLIAETGFVGDACNVAPERQAYACPYYQRLTGILGSDWGCCVNPESPRFGQLVFEHDDCGCVGDCPRGNQRSDEWLDRTGTKAELATMLDAMRGEMGSDDPGTDIRVAAIGGEG